MSDVELKWDMQTNVRVLTDWIMFGLFLAFFMLCGRLWSGVLKINVDWTPKWLRKLALIVSEESRMTDPLPPSSPQLTVLEGIEDVEIVVEDPPPAASIADSSISVPSFDQIVNKAGKPLQIFQAVVSPFVGLSSQVIPRRPWRIMAYIHAFFYCSRCVLLASPGVAHYFRFFVFGDPGEESVDFLRILADVGALGMVYALMSWPMSLIADRPLLKQLAVFSPKHLKRTSTFHFLWLVALLFVPFAFMWIPGWFQEFGPNTKYLEWYLDIRFDLLNPTGIPGMVFTTLFPALAFCGMFVQYYREQATSLEELNAKYTNTRRAGKTAKLGLASRLRGMTATGRPSSQQFPSSMISSSALQRVTEATNASKAAAVQQTSPAAPAMAGTPSAPPAQHQQAVHPPTNPNGNPNTNPLSAAALGGRFNRSGSFSDLYMRRRSSVASSYSEQTMLPLESEEVDLYWTGWEAFERSLVVVQLFSKKFSTAMIMLFLFVIMYIVDLGIELVSRPDKSFTNGTQIILYFVVVVAVITPGLRVTFAAERYMSAFENCPQELALRDFNHYVHRRSCTHRLRGFGFRVWGMVLNRTFIVRLLYITIYFIIFFAGLYTLILAR